MKHGLILVEGLPASGKSTAAAYIAELLHFRCTDEGTGSHPADYEGHALVSADELKAYFAQCRDAEEVRALSEAAELHYAGFVLPLAELAWHPAYADMLMHRIYEGVPWPPERAVMLDKWRSYAENAASDPGDVFNCVLLQNPMCETMLRLNLPQAESAAFIGEIAEIIRPLKPFVVYLKTAEIAENIRRVQPERGAEWLQAVIEYHCGGAYGRANGLSGFDGYIAALEERQRRELEILRGLKLPYLILDEPQHDWPAAYAKIRAELCGA